MPLHRTAFTGLIVSLLCFSGNDFVWVAMPKGFSNSVSAAESTNPPLPNEVNRASNQDESRSRVLDPCFALHDKSLFKPMSDIETKLTEDGKRLPTDCSTEFFRENVSGDLPRGMAVKSFHWRPTNFFHQPAYLDNVPLERYGQSVSPVAEPVASGVRFVLGAATIPYRIGIDRPHDCITTLGHQPPGNCVPCIRQTLPWEADAAFLEAATAVGLALVLP